MTIPCFSIVVTCWESILIIEAKFSRTIYIYKIMEIMIMLREEREGERERKRERESCLVSRC